MSDIEQRPTDPRGVIISFNELLRLNQRIERMDAKLDAALLQAQRIEDHEQRIVALEKSNAVRDARGGLFGKAVDAIWALLLAVIAAGVWLPK